MTLTDVEADLARQHSLTEAQERYIWHETIEPLLTADVIEEHRADPFGRHSPALDMVLTYLRSDPIRTGPRLVVVILKPEREWAVGEHSRERGIPIHVRADVYDRVEDIEHAIFLERLNAAEAAFRVGENGSVAH